MVASNKPLQVWRTAIMLHGKQRSAVVAASSRKAAAALLHINDRELKAYGSKTGNEEEMQIALSQPGTVFATDSMNYPHVYKPVKL